MFVKSINPFTDCIFLVFFAEKKLQSIGTPVTIKNVESLVAQFKKPIFQRLRSQKNYNGVKRKPKNTSSNNSIDIKRTKFEGKYIIFQLQFETFLIWFIF